MQRQEEEEEEPIQAKCDDCALIQKQGEEPEEEEELQTKPLSEQVTPLMQAQPEEEEEVQRQADQEKEEELQMQPEEEEEEVQKQPEEEEPVQAKGSREMSPAVSPSLESGIKSIKGGGRPLSESTRTFFEPRFGADFSGVRLHADSSANQLARSINAKAFTHGRDIVFGSGQYSPASSSGKQLLAHELTHVVQQNTRPTLLSKNKNSIKYGDKKTTCSQQINILSPEISDRIVPKHIAYLQRSVDKHPTKWAGGDTITTTDDSYVKIKSTAWVKWLGKNLWSKYNYPKNSIYNLGNPFGKWSEMGTYLEIHDHRDFSPDIDEHWTVWVNWPVIKKGNIIGKGGVDIKGSGRHAVLTATPILDKTARRLGTKFTMTSSVGRTSGVSIQYIGGISAQETVSGGGFVRTWWLKYELPKVATRQKIHHDTSYDIFFRYGRSVIRTNYMKGLYKYIFGGAKWSIPAEAKRKVRDGQVEVKVTGYASIPGTPEYNQKLSERRRNKVVRLLKAWLPKAKIVPAALGEFPAQEEAKKARGRDPYWQRVTVDIAFFLLRK